MEALADKGNGHYAYLDSLDEARKVLVREMDATLVTVAKDVKIQVEFNPRQVAAYRLIGYENRRLDDEDFNDDAKDAGEMGAGHTVTALYEIVPAGGRVPGRSVDPLKYQRQVAAGDARRDGELMTVALRYQRPEGGRSQRIEAVVHGRRGAARPESRLRVGRRRARPAADAVGARRDGQRRSADRAGAIVHRRGPARGSRRLRHTGGARRRFDARRARRSAGNPDRAVAAIQRIGEIAAPRDAHRCICWRSRARGGGHAAC